MIILRIISNFFELLRLVLRRIWHNLGLSLSTIIGMTAVLTLVVCVPIFSYTFSQRNLKIELTKLAELTNRSLFSFRIYYLQDNVESAIGVDDIHFIEEYLTTRMPELTGLPVKQIVTSFESPKMGLWPVVDKGYTKSGALSVLLFNSMKILPDHIKIVEGELPRPAQPGEPVEVAATLEQADAMFLNIGETYRLGDIDIVIAGIFQVTNPKDTVWFNDPFYYQEKFWVPEETFRNHLSESLEIPISYISWYVIIDESYVNYSNAKTYIHGMNRLYSEISTILPEVRMDHSPLPQLTDYQESAERMITSFYAVGAPIIVLVLLFIGLTSRIAVQQYEQEVATIRGRGASQLDILLINLFESIFLVGISLPLSLLFGWLAAHLMGNTVSFLRFTTRTDFNYSFGGINQLWLGGAVLLVVLTRLLPTLGMLRNTIVRMKQKKSRGAAKPFWERYFLDVFLLIPGFYAYFVLKGFAKPASFIEQAFEKSGDQYRDPLLFIAPALFAIALCMLLLRVIPLLMRLLAALVERLPGVWAYLSLQQIARRSEDHSSAVLLIMISLSLAIYSSSMAKTLDRWLVDSAYYSAGTELVVEEFVVEGDSQGMMMMGPSNITLTNVDAFGDTFTSVSQHRDLPGVANATRVAKYRGQFSFGTGITPCFILAVDRMEFPAVGFFRQDFADVPLGELMNLLALEENAVLFPRQLATEMGVGVGDLVTISVDVDKNNYVRKAIITGLYDYFPTVYFTDKDTVITTFETVFENPDVAVGYRYWLDLEPGADSEEVLTEIDYMLDKSGESVVKTIGDAQTEIMEKEADPSRVGLFGVINVGFLATGLMPGIGFLLYSYASLRRRFIQLGILQAIGLSIGQLIGYLVLEQVLLMGTAILGGAGIGLLASHLFVPFLQIGAAPGAQVPPFLVNVGWVEAGWLSLGFGAILLLTTAGTIVYLARLKVFQAVKMGESL